MSDPTAEILIVPPTSDPEGVAAAFVRQSLVAGLDFWFEPGDRLPDRVPEGVGGVKAILIDHRIVDAEEDRLERYRQQGAAVYPMHLDRDPRVPNSTLCWGSPRCLHAITLDAGLTSPSPAMFDRLLARDEERVIEKLCDGLMRWRPERWYDATYYNWQAMLDLSEVTGESRFADAAVRQMHGLMRDVENTLDNCDCVAAFRPMLHAAEQRGDQQIVSYVREHTDRYLRDTPRARGCLVNFGAYAQSIRAEILWQVLPAVMLLGRVTGERRFAETAWDQIECFEKHLFDQKTGLWQHGVGPAGFTGVHWARFVGFILIAHLLMLEFSEPDHPRRQSLLEKFAGTCERLEAWQNDRGFFHAVVDAPHTGEESSGTAWIATALMRAGRHGWLDERYAEMADRAWRAVSTRIWDGDFPGHMTATTVSHVPGYYHKVLLSDTGWPHFALWAWCERRRSAAVVGGRS